MRKLRNLAIGPYSIFAKPKPNLKPTYFSGVLGQDSKTNLVDSSSFRNETQLMFKNTDTRLKMANAKRTDIVKTMIFLTNMRKFKEFNKYYMEYMGEHKPARSCVEVKELPFEA